MDDPVNEVRKRRPSFGEDFRRFFLRGLAAVLPTLITISVLLSIWDFLWTHIGIHIIFLLREVWYNSGERGWVQPRAVKYIMYYLDTDNFSVQLLGVVLSIMLIYFVGIFVGNLIGRAFWRAAENAVLRVPVIRAVYPAVKQVTDFILAERSQKFQGSRVVAVQPHEQNIWSIGLVTNSAQWDLSDGPEDMVTVFVPSTPTSFSGYVLIVPRRRVVELPMTVEEAMRLLISGGVIMPGVEKTTGRSLPIENPAIPITAVNPPERLQSTGT
jgi:uncharacterized membrane protein